MCCYPLENSFHYFFECPLHNDCRQELLRSLCKYNNVNLRLLLYGSEILSDEENIEIFSVVHKFIYKSNRFE